MIGLKKETNRSVYSFNHSKSSVWDDFFVKSHFLYKSTVDVFLPSSRLQSNVSPIAVSASSLYASKASKSIFVKYTYYYWNSHYVMGEIFNRISELGKISGL